LLLLKSEKAKIKVGCCFATAIFFKTENCCKETATYFVAVSQQQFF
jgi:hypothetical protein